MDEISPDDACGVCGTTRDQHGDKNHLFSLEDVLIPLPKAAPARREAPKERGERPKVLKAEDSYTARSLATLMEILVEKDILSAKDIIRVFQGEG